MYIVRKSSCRWTCNGRAVNEMLLHLVLSKVQVLKYQNSQRISKGVLSRQTYFYARSRLSGVTVEIAASVRPSVHM